jgi:N6-L-threonylcarbamoyladenine synthase
MRILAIETSCDETAIAIADFSGTRKYPRIHIASNIVLSQVALHAKFGGVVPNIAKREHQKNLVPILLRALKEAGIRNEKAKIKKEKIRIKIKNTEEILRHGPELLRRFKKYIQPLKPPRIDAVAVTQGPGLAPALWVGVNFAKALAYAWDVPIIPVNHMAGHLYSAFLQKSGIENFQFQISNFKFPAIALLVSGGHTELVLMRGYGKYKIIGETLDDAAGEAFDKVARMLKLGYPGGPVISAYAKMQSKYQNKNIKISLPRPMLATKDYNFSFAGLKTAALYLLRDHPELAQSKTGKAAVAKEFQDAVVEVLAKKTIRAAKEFRAKTVLLGGGVAANISLREKLSQSVREELFRVSCFAPHAALTGDNALMIALAAFLEKKKPLKNLREIAADANVKLGNVNK